MWRVHSSFWVFDGYQRLHKRNFKKGRQPSKKKKPQKAALQPKDQGKKNQRLAPKTGDALIPRSGNVKGPGSLKSSNRSASASKEVEPKKRKVYRPIGMKTDAVGGGAPRESKTTSGMAEKSSPVKVTFTKEIAKQYEEYDFVTEHGLVIGVRDKCYNSIEDHYADQFKCVSHKSTLGGLIRYLHSGRMLVIHNIKSKRSIWRWDISLGSIVATNKIHGKRVSYCRFDTLLEGYEYEGRLYKTAVDSFNANYLVIRKDDQVGRLIGDSTFTSITKRTQTYSYYEVGRHLCFFSKGQFNFVPGKYAIRLKTKFLYGRVTPSILKEIKYYAMKYAHDEGLMIYPHEMGILLGYLMDKREESAVLAGVLHNNKFKQYNSLVNFEETHVFTESKGRILNRIVSVGKQILETVGGERHLFLNKSNEKKFLRQTKDLCRLIDKTSSLTQTATAVEKWLGEFPTEIIAGDLARDMLAEFQAKRLDKLGLLSNFARFLELGLIRRTVTKQSF